MYWCDWSSNPHIAVAGMDGKNIRIFVSTNLKAPQSLTIDYPTNRLYWADIKLKKIETIRLDGTDRRVNICFFFYYKIIILILYILRVYGIYLYNLIIRRLYYTI